MQGFVECGLAHRLLDEVETIEVGEIYWKLAGRQLLDGPRSRRHALPAFAMGKAAAFAGHALAGTGGVWTGRRPGVAFCV